MRKLSGKLLVLLLFLIAGNVAAQTAIPADKEHAIIIYDSNTIAVTGKKAAFIHFMVQRSVRVKIMADEARDRYAAIKLPETFDPSYIYHSSEVRNPVYCFSKIDLFAFSGSIKKTDGSIVPALITNTISTVRSVGLNGYFVYYDQPTITISNLETGDVLDLHYSYEMPYIENFEKLTSFRLFFNGCDYKEQYYLHVSADDDLNLKIQCHNTSDSGIISKSKNSKSYTWHISNLAGSADEAGARLYMELPYLMITVKPLALFYQLPFSYEERYLPLYSIATYNREDELLSVIQSNRNGVSKEYFSYFEKFIDDHTRDITSDSNGMQKMIRIHNVIVDEFRYDTDSAFYDKDIRLERLEEYLSKKILRERSRYTIYATLISILRLGFYTVYIADNRSGVISDDFVGPMFDNDFLIAAVLNDNTILLIYPKNNEAGYYVDEVPFYLENTIGRLISFKDYRDVGRPINEEFRKLNTPTSSFEDNDRKSNVMVSVNLDSINAVFNAKVVLKGQYSTMMRGLYQYGYKDKTVNKLYGQKICDIGSGVTVKQKEVNVIQKVFPFRTEVKLQYASGGLITRKNNNIYTLSLKNWFAHITDSIDDGSRSLSYFPDFKYKDTYSYLITFNKNIEITRTIENVKIENDFGSLIVSCTQSTSNSLLLTSYLMVKSDKIAAGNISEVSGIYNKVKTLNTQSIEFRITE